MEDTKILIQELYSFENRLSRELQLDRKIYISYIEDVKDLITKKPDEVPSFEDNIQAAIKLAFDDIVVSGEQERVVEFIRAKHVSNRYNLFPLVIIASEALLFALIEFGKEHEDHRKEVCMQVQNIYRKLHRKRREQAPTPPNWSVIKKWYEKREKKRNHKIPYSHIKQFTDFVFGEGITKSYITKLMKKLKVETKSKYLFDFDDKGIRPIKFGSRLYLYLTHYFIGSLGDKIFSIGGNNIDDKLHEFFELLKKSVE